MPKKLMSKKQRLQQVEREHQDFLAKYGVDDESLKDKLYDKYGKRKSVNNIPDYNEHQGHAIALSNNISGSAAQKDRQQYTGDYIIGIATTHKSNLMPVTSRKQAVEASTMRRN
jgi:hypothetical protein